MPLPLAEIDWNAVLTGEPGFAVIVMIVVLGLVGLAAIIAPQWRKVQQAHHEARLKERMIERGFTADEIIRVINAGPGRDRAGKAEDRLACCEPVKTDALPGPPAADHA